MGYSATQCVVVCKKEEKVFQNIGEVINIDEHRDCLSTGFSVPGPTGKIGNLQLGLEIPEHERESTFVKVSRVRGAPGPSRPEIG